METHSYSELVLFAVDGRGRYCCLIASLILVGSCPLHSLRIRLHYNKATNNLHTTYVILDIYFNFIVTSSAPEDVVDGSDDLFIIRFRSIGHRRARLHPHISAMFVHETVVVGQYLSLAQHCNKQHK